MAPNHKASVLNGSSDGQQTACRLIPVPEQFLDKYHHLPHRPFQMKGTGWGAYMVPTLLGFFINFSSYV